MSGRTALYALDYLCSGLSLVLLMGAECILSPSTARQERFIPENRAERVFALMLSHRIPISP